MRPILSKGGKVRGYIRENSDKQELLAPGGSLLGYYDEQKNQTLLPGGRLHGYGNLLTDLLPDE